MKYTYIDGTQNGLKLGDTVVAPTAKGDNIALVASVDVPESKIDERVLPLLKTITQLAPEETETQPQNTQPIEASIDDI
jgi:hypothetical protein